MWGLMRSAGPAGLICSTPREVLAFARLHLNGGLTDDGVRIISAQSATAMQTAQFEVPDPYMLGHAWGLGWLLDEWDGHPVYGHDGGTVGQSAFLRVLPGSDLAICLLTNGGDTHGLYRELFQEIVRDVAGVAMREPLTPTADPEPVNPGDYVGLYERLSTRIEILERDGGLVMRHTPTGPLAHLMPEGDPETPMHPVRPGLFLIQHPGMEGWFPMVFYTLADGTPYLHHGARATPKVG
jgi:hypothetical protein